MHMIVTATAAPRLMRSSGPATRVSPGPGQLVPAPCVAAYASFKTIRGIRPSSLAPELLGRSRLPRLLHRCRLTCRRTAPLPPHAGLYSLPADLVSSLQTGCGIAYLLALGFSALPILTGDSLERNERRFLQPTDEDSAGERFAFAMLISHLVLLQAALHMNFNRIRELSRDVLGEGVESICTW